MYRLISAFNISPRVKDERSPCSNLAPRVSHLSTLAPCGGKMRDPGSEVGVIIHAKIAFTFRVETELSVIFICR